ncbi:hypothetical protein C8N47_105140 [Mangrovibacterium marinum]|uniref:Macro domain-containing protein n=1 Tax=Mangrovibacterium marinum TaxID=1639118 RepID=A0A2T5C3I5_9BACT|nr:hypothetical protein [Mangrovibacterium marinum]PTN09299.1 hypothetical protein C8N47_105140 [Mangrovibacterium marinum]
METSHIFNITEIPRSSYRPLNLEFYGGDITSVFSDVLLTSAFQGNFYPTPNTILGRINERFGIHFSNLPENATRLGDRLFDFGSPTTSSYKRLWVLEISQLGNREGRSTDLYKSIKSLEKLNEVIDYLGVKSISIPLLGTGAQGLSIEESAMSLISVVIKWAQNSSSLETVRVFAYNLQAAAKLNQLIDTFFGHEQKQPSSTSVELLKASKQELKEKIGGFHEQLRHNLDEVSNLLDSPNPSVKSIAVAGRNLAETCSENLLNIWFPEEDASELNLNERIQMIQDKIRKEKSWMLSYFRLLQSSGNIGAHSSRQVLDLVDATAIVIAVLRIAEYTSDHIKNYLN